MVIGASDESDYQIISVSEALYQKFEMKRIFYSAFINVNHDSSLPDLPGPPLLREHRLYQADFLLRFMDSAQMNCCQRKIRILTNRLIRSVIGQCTIWNCFQWKLIVRIIIRCFVCRGSEPKVPAGLWRPGGTQSWSFSDLKKIGVVLKRAVYFITCKGKMMYHTRMEEGYITRNLMYQERPMQMLLSDGTVQTYEQLSLFDDRGKNCSMSEQIVLRCEDSLEGNFYSTFRCVCVQK